KRVFLVILFTSFSGSLVSRIPGAVHAEWKDQFRKISDRIRSSGMSVSEYLQRQGLLSPESGEENNPVSHNNNVA
ncbi:hypothetical protein RNM85_18315, partial [Escherichia coli]|nr:hypothetical protein [Escherichia coli]